MKLKRTLCILLTVCLLLTAFPAALAAERCSCGYDPVIVLAGYTSSTLFVDYGTPQQRQIEYAPSGAEICTAAGQGNWKGIYRQLGCAGGGVQQRVR